VNTFVTLATRKRPVVFIAWRGLIDDTPVALCQVLVGVWTSSTAPGEPVAATMLFRIPSSFAARGAGAPAAVGAVRSAIASALPTAEVASLEASFMGISFCDSRY